MTEKKTTTGQAEEVGGVDRHIESGIVVDAHGALHPVDDALAMGTRRAIAADQDPRSVRELGEWVRERQAGHARFYSPRGTGHEARRVN